MLILISPLATFSGLLAHSLAFFGCFLFLPHPSPLGDTEEEAFLAPRQDIRDNRHSCKRRKNQHRPIFPPKKLAPNISSFLRAFPKIQQFFACFSQKLAPARKNSTDWSTQLRLEFVPGTKVTQGALDVMQSIDCLISSRFLLKMIVLVCLCYESTWEKSCKICSAPRLLATACQGLLKEHQKKGFGSCQCGPRYPPRCSSHRWVEHLFPPPDQIYINITQTVPDEKPECQGPPREMVNLREKLCVRKCWPSAMASKRHKS